MKAIKTMKAGKRVFIGLMALSIFLFAVLIYYLWRVAFAQEYIYRALFMVVIVLLLLLTVLAVVGIAGLVLSIIRGKNVSFFQASVYRTMNILYPFVIQIGRLLKITQDRIQISFVEVNNKLLESKRTFVSPENLLVLLPHCLQKDDCSHKLTNEISNCLHCGKCDISSLSRLAAKYKVAIEVVTGGTLARQAVKQYEPQLILAVACERDLNSGIIDSSPLPVYGIINDRPAGPCYNTRVKVDKLEEAINKFLGGELEG